MPDCPISAPPPLFVLQPPWELPLNWLVYFALLALTIAKGVHEYRTKLRYVVPTARRRMATILTQMQYTGFVAVYFYFILLSLPSFDRLSSWSHVQFRLFASQGCNLSPLFYIEDNLRNTQEEWFLGVFAVYLLGAIIFGVVRKRYMSQPQVAAETQDASAVR